MHPSGDLATLYPYHFPTSSRVVSAVVEFCSEGDAVDYTTEMLADERTVIDLSSSSNVAHLEDGSFVAESNVGSAEVRVTFNGLVSASQVLNVVGHRAGSLPEPCAAEMVLSDSEIANLEDLASTLPFSLPGVSTIQSVSVHFCSSGTSSAEAVRGKTQWPAVSGGSAVAAASHWGLEVSVVSGSSAASLQLAGSGYTVTASGACGRASLRAAFGSAFAPGVSAAQSVDVMRFSSTNAGEWCITNDEVGGAASRKCRNICSSSLSVDHSAIAYPGSTPTHQPFAFPAQSRVTAFSVRFCGPSCGACSSSATHDMKSDPRAQFTAAGVAHASLVVRAQADHAVTGTLSASLQDGGQQSAAQVLSWDPRLAHLPNPGLL